MLMLKKVELGINMLITFEGIDGSGKTTQIHKAFEFLTRANYSAIKTREPGGTDIGQHIRSFLLNPENENMSSLCEFLLYEADRAQHLDTVIRPALAEGTIILCDRFIDSSLAYQGFARGLSIQLIEKIQSIVSQEIRPNITLLFDIDPKLSTSRALNALKNGERKLEESRFESKSIEFYKCVRKGYLELATNERDRFWIIDAADTPHKVFEQVIKGIETCVPSLSNYMEGGGLYEKLTSS